MNKQWHKKFFSYACLPSDSTDLKSYKLENIPVQWYNQVDCPLWNFTLTLNVACDSFTVVPVAVYVKHPNH